MSTSSTLAIGSFWQDTETEHAGRVYIFNSIDLSVVSTLISPEEELGGGFGLSVSGVPDLTDDGVVDIAVGSMEDDNDTSESRGKVHLFDGVSFDYLRTLLPVEGSPDLFFGDRLVGVEDVNGDGAGDVAVFSLSQSAGLYLFSGLTGELIDRIPPPAGEPWSAKTHRPFAMCDITGDGVNELGVGDARGEGVYIYDLVEKEIVRIIRLESFTGPDEDHFGRASVLPDIDQDGWCDLLVGAPETGVDSLDRVGRAYVFNPITGEQIPSLTKRISSYLLGNGDGYDLNGDGVVDVGDVVTASILETMHRY